MSFMMESNGTTIQYVFFIKIITEAQAQKVAAVIEDLKVRDEVPKWKDPEPMIRRHL